MKKIKDDGYRKKSAKRIPRSEYFSSKKPRVPDNYTFNNTGARGK